MKSLSTSPLPFMNPFSPSRSILPAQTRHSIGRNSGVPRTRPRHTANMATIVSIDMSSGRDATVDADAPWDAIAAAWSVECSFAE